MADMKYLAPAMLADIQKECGPEWAEAVTAGATDVQIKKTIQKVSGNVYRRMLNEAAASKV
jgi:cobalamin biosynthesis protein CobD/CbiB